jgi:dihydropteroate synthase
LGKLPTEIVLETQHLHLKALKNGAKILRVHDVMETKNTLDIFLGT